MAKTFTNSDVVARAFGKFFHQKLNFLPNVDLQYDNDSIGKYGPDNNSIGIRLPNKFIAGTGATITEGDKTEQKVVLTKATQYHSLLPWYTSAEAAGNVELDRMIENDVMPAAESMAARVEADMLAIAYAGCPYQVGTPGTAATFDGVLGAARERMQNSLAPTDRKILLTSGMARAIVNDTKGLTQSADNIRTQYREGLLGRTAGFDVYENTLLPRHTSGTSAATGYLVNGTYTNGSTTIPVDTGTGTLVAGDIITIANVFECHPETKAATTRPYQLVVAANYAGGAGNVTVRNPMYSSASPTAALQNVTALPADNAAITKVGTASQAYDVGLAFSKQFFAFGSRDLLMPNDVHAKSSQTVDGIRFRFLQQYDGINDRLITRLDILCGGVVVRPEAATRIAV